LAFVDDVVGQPEECRNRSEGQAGRHHQGRIHSFFALKPEEPRQRQDADEFGDHLDSEIDHDQAGRIDDDIGAHQRPRLQEIERGQHRERDHPDPVGQLLVGEKDGCEHHADQIGRQYGSLPYWRARRAQTGSTERT